MMLPVHSNILQNIQIFRKGKFPKIDVRNRTLAKRSIRVERGKLKELLSRKQH